MADQEDLDCAICQDTYQNACISSCGHSFCAKCILSYWRTLDQSLPVRCPLDRSPVSFLSANHSLRERCARQRGVPNETLATRPREDAALNDYNQRFSQQPRGLRQELREDVALYRNLPVSNIQKLIINGLFLVVLAYVIFPIDLIPDTLGLVGFLDDFFAIAIILFVVIAMLNGIRNSVIQEGMH